MGKIRPLILFSMRMLLVTAGPIDSACRSEISQLSNNDHVIAENDNTSGSPQPVYISIATGTDTYVERQTKVVKLSDAPTNLTVPKPERLENNDEPSKPSGSSNNSRILDILLSAIEATTGVAGVVVAITIYKLTMRHGVRNNDVNIDVEMNNLSRPDPVPASAVGPDPADSTCAMPPTENEHRTRPHSSLGPPKNDVHSAVDADVSSSSQI